MFYDKESDFEDDLVAVLKRHGWTDGVLEYPTEQDLIDNWANILFDNNKGIDRLNGQRLTKGEMAQILEQIETLRTPLALNSFINGKTVSIKRDNPADTAHFGKEISLKIYDRQEIAAGQSRYQIARQPIYPAKSKMLNDRRGDVCLLINGMPVIHIELKKSGIPISQATNQIAKYAHEGVFTGLFRLVQVFVAMNPDDAVYFANPGEGDFNSNYFFHWADFNNEPIAANNHVGQDEWKRFTSDLLSIPMAHQLIGFYTVADSADGCLKVLRSYQYQAVNAISDRVRTCKWDEPVPSGTPGRPGGYVWHTTGSGKTMTSFKAAQLIAGSKDADKVVFLMDRVELGTQSLLEYRSFADDADDVQGTENTDVLKSKLASIDPKDTLIVTSIQKMSNIKAGEGHITEEEVKKLAGKRIVFIIDECHRSTFGEMLQDIRHSFPNALYFGFTGTPIHEENRKKGATTSMVFGDCLHRYSIADGIRDGNVLGFDTCPVATYPEFDLRQAVALDEAKAKSMEEVMGDPRRERVYYQIMDEMPMAPFLDEMGNRCHGIESLVPESQYGTADQRDVTEHQRQVVADIVKHWPTLSRFGKFHAIFATHSIPEALDYYHLFKETAPELMTTVLVDPSIDNEQEKIDRSLIKEEALEEVIADYNERFGMEFALPTWSAFKTDVSNRLAHKRPYLGIEKTPEKCVNILIVVDQMLTGFDSKWINTLYLDKMLRYEMIIQAFSRTNRLFNESEKPHGTIRYYRRPHTMRKNIEEAISLYSGDKPFGLFVPKLRENLLAMNLVFEDMIGLFEGNGAGDLSKLPDSSEARNKFAQLFRSFNALLEAAKVQGFRWDESEYQFPVGDDVVEEAIAVGACEDECGAERSELYEVIAVPYDETDYLAFAQRYKELAGGGGRERGGADIPYDLSGHLMEIDTTKIDTDYMNANFTKWLKQLDLEGSEAEATEAALAALHKSFASLSQEEQKYANLFIHDVQSGDVYVDPGKTFRDYVTEYQRHAKNVQIGRASSLLGVDAAILSELLVAGADEESLNEFGRFDKLIDSLDTARAREYFSALEGAPIPAFKVRMRADNLLRRFVLEGGFDL